MKTTQYQGPYRQGGRLASLAAGIAVILLAGAHNTQAQDWPMWGGSPDRNMHAPDAENLPERVDPGERASGDQAIDMETTKNVKWAVKLGSQTYGNPVVADGKVFVGTNNESPRDPRFEGDYSVVMCFDEATGEFLWQLVTPKLGAGKVNDWERLGMLSSPYVDGDRVYLVTTRNEVICLDANGMTNGNDGPFQDEGQYFVDEGQPPVETEDDDADIIWVYDMMNELGVFPHNSSNCSPLVVDGKVYVGTSNGVDWTHKNIPSPYSPSFICLDQETGELLGEDNTSISQDLFHGQWSSPSYGEVDGREMIFYGGGDGYLYAFDPEPEPDEETGFSFMETIWKADANPPHYRHDDQGNPIEYPDPDGPSEINATPVLYDDKVYVAIGQDPAHGEGIGNFVCVDASLSGDITDEGIVWNYEGMNRSISTAAIMDDLVYVADFSGFFYCLDAQTGELYWTHDLKAHVWGSPLVADGKVYVGDEDGDLVVFRAGKEKEVLSTVTRNGRELDGPNLRAPVYASPIVANDVLYIASNTHLYAFEQDAEPVSTADRIGEVDLEEE